MPGAFTGTWDAVSVSCSRPCDWRRRFKRVGIVLACDFRRVAPSLHGVRCHCSSRSCRHTPGSFRSYRIGSRPQNDYHPCVVGKRCRPLRRGSTADDCGFKTLKFCSRRAGSNRACFASVDGTSRYAKAFPQPLAGRGKISAWMTVATLEKVSEPVSLSGLAPQLARSAEG